MIISQWLEPLDQVRVETCDGSTGLSGSQVWKVTFRDKALCLKRWPAFHFSNELLQKQHRLLKHVRDRGFHWSPVPRLTSEGKSVVSSQGYLWDLITWMPGAPLTRHNLKRLPLQQAMKLLAEFHMAAEKFESFSVVASPGLQQRLEIARSLAMGGLAELVGSLREYPISPLQSILNVIAGGLERALPKVLPRLESRADRPLPQQWCLRDVKFDHVLFETGRPSGLIDFGAAAPESVAGDVARLVGSLEDVTHADWQTAMDAYGSVRPLSAAEQEATPLFDLGGVISAGANWLRWLVVERRQLENHETVLAQLKWLGNRLESVS